MKKILDVVNYLEELQMLMDDVYNSQTITPEQLRNNVKLFSGQVNLALRECYNILDANKKSIKANK